ncbi:MAG: amino acid permease [Gemmatimonadetes bacterium]|nr:amino acid permease [Gemmatimonadota bacterium]MCC6770513.1 amino acid permease [Gemmatimonadaceae bacterium]
MSTSPSSNERAVAEPDLSPRDESSRGLPRRIGLWSAVAVCIGSTIGSGIFRSPAGIADKIPGPLPLLMIWTVGGLFALCGALTLSEVASYLPNTGGFYAFLREGWGRIYAFLFGWGQLTIVRAAALGAIAITFAEYFMRVIGFDPSVAPYDQYARYVAAGAIALTAAFNIVGVRWGTTITNITTVAKFGGLLFIIGAALSLGLPATGGNYTPMVPEGSFAWGSAGLALVSVLWAYDGWGDVSYVAGEVKDPQRNLPRALIGGTLAVITIYVLANLAYLAVLPVEKIRVSKLVAADVAEVVLGRPGVIFVSVTVMLSTFGTLSAVLLTSPRVLFAMADDGMLFKPVAAVHPRFKTPYVAISLVATLGLVYVLFLTFEKLADTFVIAMLPFYALGVAAVYRLRARPGYVPKFRTPGYPVVPAIFLLSVVILLGNALADTGSRAWTAGIFAVLLAGIPIYMIFVPKKS